MKTANQKVYIVNDFKVEETTYEQMVWNFSEETTTPIGIAPKIHVREKEYFLGNHEELCLTKEQAIDSFDDCGYEDEELTLKQQNIEEVKKFEVWTWGCAGNSPKKLDSFDTEEEADKDVFEHAEHNMHNADNRPTYFFNKEEAEQWIKENIEE